MCSLLHTTGVRIPVFDIRRGLPQLGAIMTDACTKMSHYRNAGSQYAGLQRSRSIYYGEAQDIIASATAAGTRVGPAVSATAAAEGEATACDSHLTCARHSSQPNIVVDTHGILCWYCPHGQPAEGSLVDMPSPENFSCAFYMPHIVSSTLKPGNLASFVFARL